VTYRIAFLGTHHPAVPTLECLAERNWVACVILPEKAGSKNDELLEICSRNNLSWSYELQAIEQYAPNMILAANYPNIVPTQFLSAYPCINTHWSLLPRWRGVHPTAWALINGDCEIGLSVHMMEREFDTGRILAQSSVTVSPDTRIEELHTTLATLQAQTVLQVLESYQDTGRLEGSEQEELDAIYVPQRVPDDGIIDWTWSTKRIDAQIRALPVPLYPGAFTYLNNRRLIIVSATPAPSPEYFCTAGQVVRRRANGDVWVKTGDTCLIVEKVQWEGDDTPQTAAKILKRGVKLGYNSQQEIALLRRELNAMRAQLDALTKVQTNGSGKNS